MRRFFCRMKGFFDSWYGNKIVWVIMAALSAFSVTFYATRLPLLHSFTKTHLINFLASFVLMYVLAMIIAWLSYVFDRLSSPVKKKRYVWTRVVLFATVLPFLVLRIVYEIYDSMFGVDLSKTEYVDRDFVVVVFCMFMMQGYYIIRRDEKRIQRLNEDIQEMKLQRHDLEQRIIGVDQVNGRMNKMLDLMKQLMLPVEVRLEDEGEVSVPIHLVSTFYIAKPFAGQKIVHIRLMDGRRGETRDNALSEIMKKYSLLCYKLTRSELVSLLAIESIEKTSEEAYLHLRGEGEEARIIPNGALKELEEAQEQLQQLIQQRG